MRRAKPRKTAPANRRGDVTATRTYKNGRKVSQTGVNSPNTEGNKRLRGDATKARMRRNVSAARSATKANAANAAAKAATRAAAGKMAARAVPGVGAALTAIDVAGRVGGPGGKPAGKRVRKNGTSTRKR